MEGNLINEPHYRIVMDPPIKLSRSQPSFLTVQITRLFSSEIRNCVSFIQRLVPKIH